MGFEPTHPIGNGFTVRRSSPTLPPSHIKLDETSREVRYNWESNPEVYSSAMYSKNLIIAEIRLMATPTGFEPVVSCVTGMRFKPD